MTAIKALVAATGSAMLLVGTPVASADLSAIKDMKAPLNRPVVHDNGSFTMGLLENFEERLSSSGNTLAWDAQLWHGTDYHRLWLKSEGNARGGQVRNGDVEAFYDQPVTAFWDLQAGVRYDLEPAPSRGWLAFGVEGLAPYFVDVEATAYAGPQGATAARFKASFDILFTQRLILTPKIETNLYGQSMAAQGIGSGVSDLEAGLRLRYEIHRQFAPYIGVVYTSDYGGTAAATRAAGRKTHETRLLGGVRAWF